MARVADAARASGPASEAATTSSPAGSYPITVTDAGTLAEAAARGASGSTIGWLRDSADVSIDTSALMPHQFKQLLTGHFAIGRHAGMRISVMSFSFRRGLRLTEVIADAGADETATGVSAPTAGWHVLLRSARWVKARVRSRPAWRSIRDRQ